MLSIAPAASAAPPDDRVDILEFGGEVDCDPGLLTFESTGWVNGKSDGGFFYHLTWVFSNADGATWTYIDTGRVRFFERGGVLYGSLAGRSVNVGPDDSSWIGHWVINTETGDYLSRA